MWKRRIVYFVFLISVLSQSVPVHSFAKIKKEALVEDIYDDGEQRSVWRKEYGLIAENVAEVYIGTEPDFWELYIRQKKKVKEIQLTQKEHGKYKAYVVSENCKKIYPQIDGNITVDNKNRILFNGICSCGFLLNIRRRSNVIRLIA